MVNLSSIRQFPATKKSKFRCRPMYLAISLRFLITWPFGLVPRYIFWVEPAKKYQDDLELKQNLSPRMASECLCPREQHVLSPKATLQTLVAGQQWMVQGSGNSEQFYIVSDHERFKIYQKILTRKNHRQP